MNVILVEIFLSLSIIYVNTLKMHDRRTQLNLIKWEEEEEADKKKIKSEHTLKQHNIIPSDGT